tara:strand:+ start:4068 stop:4241 length:174 start_codon:yes stop_codon:yes gene_type:complete
MITPYKNRLIKKLNYAFPQTSALNECRVTFILPFANTIDANKSMPKINVSLLVTTPK